MIALFFAFLGLNQLLTPGALCSPADADFDHVADPGNYAVCRRHVTRSMRNAVFRSYGITVPRGRRYELDHLIPLCAGGSNSLLNLWPEPIADAPAKDKREARVCAQLRRGTITQAQAAQEFLR